MHPRREVVVHPLFAKRPQSARSDDDRLEALADDVDDHLVNLLNCSTVDRTND